MVHCIDTWLDLRGGGIWGCVGGGGGPCDTKNQSHYIEVAQGGVSIRAIHYSL